MFKRNDSPSIYKAKVSIKTAKKRVLDAKLIGWPALEASWQADLDKLLAEKGKARV